MYDYMKLVEKTLVSVFLLGAMLAVLGLISLALFDCVALIIAGLCTIAFSAAAFICYAMVKVWID